MRADDAQVATPEPKRYPATEVDLRSNDSLAWQFAVNDELGELLRRWWATTRIGLPEEGIAPAQGMVIFALGKGYKTHVALRRLCAAGYGEDASVLVRSLFELATDVRYVAQEPIGDRPVRWVDYDHVSRYEMNRVILTDPLFATERQAAQSNPTLQAEIESEATRVQNAWQFWKGRRKSDGVLFRPRHWSGLNRHELARRVGWESHYNSLYKLTSILAHSDVRTVNRYIRGDAESGMTVDVRPGPEGVQQALLSGFIYLHEIARDWVTIMGAPEAMGIELRSIEIRFVEQATHLFAGREVVEEMLEGPPSL